jgi:uncharacterized lipoprotein
MSLRPASGMRPASGIRLALCLLVLLPQAGCSWVHHGRHARCFQPPVGGDVRNLPPLKVPAGLDAPDTRNAIKIPPLNEPERPRAPTDPCLAQPPSFKS